MHNNGQAGKERVRQESIAGKCGMHSLADASTAKDSNQCDATDSARILLTNSVSLQRQPSRRMTKRGKGQTMLYARVDKWCEIKDERRTELLCSRQANKTDPDAAAGPDRREIKSTVNRICHQSEGERDPPLCAPVTVLVLFYRWRPSSKLQPGTDKTQATEMKETQ